MKNSRVNLWYKKTVFCVAALTVVLVMSVSGSCLAAGFDSIKVYPAHVGIFTTVGEQQFVAFGLKAGANPVNITKNVDWISSNTDIVTIDENGLAKIAADSGQVKVTASYPKTGKAMVPPNFLLLRGGKLGVK